MGTRAVPCVLAIACLINVAAPCLRPACGAEDAPAIWTYEDFVRGRIPQTYAVAESHPRLLITPGDRHEIIAKAKAAPKLFQKVISQAERGKGEPAILACGAVYQLGLIPRFSSS